VIGVAALWTSGKSDISTRRVVTAIGQAPIL